MAIRITKTSKDVYWTVDGDFWKDPDGGHTDDVYFAVSDTNDECLVSAIRRRLQTSAYDWGFPSLVHTGTSLSEFAGALNDTQTRTEIKAEVYRSLTSGGLVSANRLSIDVIPVGPRSILITILVRSQSQPEPIFLSFGYDLRDNKLIPRNVE